MRIAVVGAGPAGLVACLAAKRLGFELVGFEQAPDFSRVGSAVGLAPNGLQVLEALDLLESFRPLMHVQRFGVVQAPPGRVLTRTDMLEIAIPHAGFAVVLRYDLQQHLLDAALRDGIDLRFGARCTGVELVDRRARLRFADGRVEEADVIIACDGVHSPIRESLGLGARIGYVGEAYLRCVSPASIRDPIDSGEMWAADGRRFGMFPLASGATYFFCSVPLGHWSEIRTNDLSRWIESWRDFGDDVMHVVRAVEDWSSANYDELKEVHLDRWCEPPVFLAGDAAHAMTPNLGQGANSAMVDALVLVRVLRECLDGGGSLDDVARRYEYVRKAFATRIQSMARSGGRFAAWTSPWARALRDASLRVLLSIPPIRRRALRIAAGYNPREQPYFRPLPVSSRGT